jgi:ATP adenylyltransferase
MQPYYYFANYRTEEQLAEMRRLEATGVCLFCPTNLGQNQEVVHRTDHWSVTPNRFPYRDTRLHLLLVPHAHVTDILDLEPAAQADFFTALGWVRGQHDLRYYALDSRCGDDACAHGGSTIRHLHVHVIVGDVDDPAHQPVKVKVSQRAKPELEAKLRSELDPDQLDAGLA